MRVRIPTASAAPEKPYFFLYLNSYELLTPFHFFGANFFSVSAKDGVKRYCECGQMLPRFGQADDWEEMSRPVPILCGTSIRRPTLLTTVS